MTGEMYRCDSQQFETGVGQMGETEANEQPSHLYHKTSTIESHTNHLLFRIGYLSRPLPFFSSTMEFTRSLPVRSHTHHFFISFCRSMLTYPAIVLHHTCIHDLPSSGYVSRPYQSCTHEKPALFLKTTSF